MRALIFLSLPPSQCHSAVHSLTQTTAWRPATHENQPWLCHVLLHTSLLSLCCFTYLSFCKKRSILIQTLVCLYTFVVTVYRAGVIMSLWEFFTHFFGLVLQSLLKPICFAHLIANSSFILIASQFKRGLRQIVIKWKSLTCWSDTSKASLQQKEKKGGNER